MSNAHLLNQSEEDDVVQILDDNGMLDAVHEELEVCC